MRKHAITVRALLDWFDKSARDLPWRRTNDPYAIWVSEIMLQQTQVKTVIPYWERWMGELPTIQSLAEAPLEKVLKLWEGLGYYSRARNMQKAAQIIIQEHHGRFPEQHDAILALPGIGRYTAGAIASIAFNQPEPILDGNVIRVLTRLHGIAGNPRDKAVNGHLWDLASQLVKAAAKLEQRAPLNAPSKRYCSLFNQSLMELGALVCAPSSPQCGICPLKNKCAGRSKGIQSNLPNLCTRAKATARRFAAFIWYKDRRFLVRQRPEAGVNAGLWEFPNLELALETSGVESAAAQALGRQLISLVPLGTIKHSITRYRITLEVYLATPQRKDKPRDGETWLTRSQLESLPFTSAHKQILDRHLPTLIAGNKNPGVS